jgi:hypothetical protein
LAINRYGEQEHRLQRRRIQRVKLFVGKS